MKKYSNKLSINAQAGFSLVDVMVGMVIALLGVIIIFQVFSVSESVKRTTTSGGDAVQSGALGLYTLERSLKQAGYGIFSSTNIPPLPSDPAGTAPVTITPASAVNGSDSIVLQYRQNWDFGPFPPDPVVFASAVPPALTIETITVNSSAQLVSTITGGGAAAASSVIAEGIVLLKAEYGTDASGDGDLESGEWDQAVPANVLSVLAVRLAVVARSAQPEKPSVVGGACDTTLINTPAYPAWVDSAAVPLDISANLGLGAGVPATEWRCYRYKTFESTVPLRNVIWRP